MLTSPHGMELMDASAATAADIKVAGEARLQDVYAAWLQRSSAAGQVLLPATPQVVASTICAALLAVKHGDGDYATKVAQLRVLAQMIGSGLMPG